MKSEHSIASEKLAEEATAKTTEQLVAAIFYEALNENTKPPEIRVALGAAQFSALLHKVAKKAEQQTRVLIVLTVVLVVLTVVIAWFTIEIAKLEKTPAFKNKTDSQQIPTNVQAGPRN